MAGNRLNSKQSRSLAPDNRRGRNELNGRLQEHLVRAAVRPGGTGGSKEIARELGVPYSTITAHLRALVGSGKVYQDYTVNPFRTRFCHEFRIGLRVDAHRIKTEYDAALKTRDVPAKRGETRYAGPIEWFLARVIARLDTYKGLADHLIIADAVILHGAHGRDVELTVLTDDGIYSVGRYVREVLVAEPEILEAMTQTVGWRYRFLGYSGQHANG